MNFIFDVDDTLYNQFIPFFEAYKQLGLHTLYTIDVEALFTRSRAYSELVFDQVCKKEMTIEESGVFRITRAFLDDGIQISEPMALALQQEYGKQQSHIQMSEVMKQLLLNLHKQGHTLGVITNGPQNHQQKKIDAMQLVRYIPEKHIFISGTYGVNKPETTLFKICEKQMGMQEEDTYYIGDSYENDVIGANRAGWKSIYFNRRGHALVEEANYVVKSEEELVLLIKNITTNKWNSKLK